jgi:hypothetical protein
MTTTIPEELRSVTQCQTASVQGRAEGHRFLQTLFFDRVSSSRLRGPPRNSFSCVSRLCGNHG